MLERVPFPLLGRRHPSTLSRVYRVARHATLQPQCLSAFGGLRFPAPTRSRLRADTRPQPEALTVPDPCSVLADPLDLLPCPAGRQCVGRDLVEVEVVTAANELLQRAHEVGLVLSLDESVVVVDETFRVIEGDTNDRIAE